MFQKLKLKRGGKNSTVFSIILVIAGLVIAGLFSHFGYDPVSDFFGLRKPPITTKPVDGIVQVHFIDVGQGDCVLILTENHSVLIDSGDSKYASAVIAYIKQAGAESLDLIIASHPHADHIGGMDRIIAEFKPADLLMPHLPDELVPTTATFERMLDAIEKHEVNAAYAESESWHFDDAELIITPPSPDAGFDNVNDYSVLAKLIHGDNSFLFTGDMEQPAENNILESGVDVTASVIKVAHHGSKTSSKRKFMQTTNAEYAVISVGAPNRYNHPHSDTIRRITQMGFDILRTDQLGTIVFTSNDGRLTIDTEREGL